MLHNPTSRKCLLAITGAFDLGGGIAAVNRLIVHTLDEAGYDLRLFALNETHASKAKYAQFGRLQYVGMDGNKIRFMAAVWRAALTQRYTLIFCDHVNLAAILRPLAALRVIHYSVFLHGVEVFPPSPTFEGRIGLTGAQNCLANSDCTRQRVSHQFPNLTIKVCDLGLSPAQSALTQIMKPAITELSLTAVNTIVYPLGTRVILHVGRMASGERYKGQDTLIQAMSTILSECPEAQLVLVGSGDDLPRLKELACTQLPRVQSAIFMPGYVSDGMLNDLYQGCYLFAMPSWGEGFGLVYIEAMRWGKPCVGSRLDAAQCVIQDGKTGLLIDDPHAPQSVAEKITGLLKHEDAAQVMGREGYERVQKYYLFPHFKARFLKAVELPQ